jgi:hypothetical protein
MSPELLLEKIELAKIENEKHNELIRQADIAVHRAYIDGGIGEAELNYARVRKDAVKARNAYRELMLLYNDGRY